MLCKKYKVLSDGSTRFKMLSAITRFTRDWDAKYTSHVCNAKKIPMDADV